MTKKTNPLGRDATETTCDHELSLHLWETCCETDEACLCEVCGETLLQPLDEVTDAAEKAFWAVVAAAHPTATSGDLSPGHTVAFYTAARHAIEAWRIANIGD